MRRECSFLQEPLVPSTSMAAAPAVGVHGLPPRRGDDRTHASDVGTCGRAVECTGFENRQTRKGLVSSNLTGSARIGCLSTKRRDRA
jgi:hypothetical protein